MDTEPLTARERHHPRIGRRHGHGSLSIGTIVRGFLVDGRPLPSDSAHLRVMDEQSGRATGFGTDELVKAVEKAAGRVAKSFPGSVLPVGNLSRGGGGRLKWSLSHRSGRDADMGFYLIDDSGRQVFQDCMTRVDRDGFTELEDGRRVMFDPARNWTLLKSFLTDRSISVHWIFVADHLKARLIDYAVSRNEPEWLISKADQAVAQPRGPIHDDHFHLRIYCSRDDLLEGCIDKGTNRPWYVGPGPAVGRRYRELVRLAGSRDPLVRRDAAVVLGHFGDRRAKTKIASMLFDRDVEVRRAAVESIEWLGCRGVESRVARAVLDDSTPDDLAWRLLVLVLREFTAGRDSDRLREAFESLSKADRTLSFDNGVFVTQVEVSTQVADTGFMRPSDGAVAEDGREKGVGRQGGAVK